MELRADPSEPVERVRELVSYGGTLTSLCQVRSLSVASFAARRGMGLVKGSSPRARCHPMTRKGGVVRTQVKGLDRFSALRSLCVHGHTLSAIGGLERCTALTDLNLSSNHLSHISGLDTLTNLQYLNLSRNRLTVVTGAGQNQPSLL